MRLHLGAPRGRGQQLGLARIRPSAVQSALRRCPHSLVTPNWLGCSSIRPSGAATSVARTEVLPTGFAALDERLPGGGWPRSGLIEILVSRFGVGELTLLLPVLAALTRRPMARWCVWVGSALSSPLHRSPRALHGSSARLADAPARRRRARSPTGVRPRRRSVGFRAIAGLGRVRYRHGVGEETAGKGDPAAAARGRAGPAPSECCFVRCRQPGSPPHAVLRMAVEPLGTGVRLRC